MPAFRRTQTDGASSNCGPHSTAIGNKLDPRYDSDLDHRGTTQGSTNYGLHHTKLGNKLDPRYDSDRVNRDAGYRCHACGVMNYASHSTNVSNEPAPRYGSDIDYPGARTGSTNYGPHGNVRNKLDPRYDSDLDHRGRAEYPSDQGFTSAHGDSGDHGHQTGTGAQLPHQSNFLNKLDPRVDSKHGTRRL
jgi:hypothetical protein